MFLKTFNRTELLLFLSSLFSVLFVVTNLIGAKIAALPFSHFATTSGVFIYPLTFFLSDLVAETYGEKRARQMVFLGFTMCLFTFLILQFVLRLTPHPLWVVADNPHGYQDVSEYQNAFKAVFGLSGMMMLASLAAYLVGQLLDIRLFMLIKKWSRGKHLWLRNLLSTLISQGIDSLVISSIFLIGGMKMSLHDGGVVMIGSFLFKIFFALLMMPLLYLCRRKIRSSQKSQPPPPGAIKLMRRFLFFCPILLFLLLIPWLSQLDLALSDHFYSQGEFYESALTRFMYTYGELFGFLTGGIALCLFFGSFLIKRLHKMRRGALAMVLTLSLGCGVIANALLKEYWGRPRPKQIEQFGGELTFRPFYKPDFSSDRVPQKSFPSGHAAMGYYFFSLLLAGRRHRKAWLTSLGGFLTLALGVGLSITRVVQGGHFFSDVLFSSILMWYVAWGIDRLLHRRQLGEESTPKESLASL